MNKILNSTMVLAALVILPVATEATAGVSSGAPQSAAIIMPHPRGMAYTHPIIGVWDATVTITRCDTGEVITEAHALNAFFPGGMLMDANTMPAGARGQSFGAWHAQWIGPDNGSGVGELPPAVTARMRFYRYGDNGMVVGTNVIDREVQVDAGGDTYSGVADGHILDLQGNELMHVCTWETAVRVE